jgi:hypothetical protein
MVRARINNLDNAGGGPQVGVERQHFCEDIVHES